MLGIRQQMFGSELLDVDTINIGSTVRPDVVFIASCWGFADHFKKDIQASMASSYV